MVDRFDERRVGGQIGVLRRVASGGRSGHRRGRRLAPGHQVGVVSRVGGAAVRSQQLLVGQSSDRVEELREPGLSHQALLLLLLLLLIVVLLVMMADLVVVVDTPLQLVLFRKFTAN